MLDLVLDVLVGRTDPATAPAPPGTYTMLQ